MLQLSNNVVLIEDGSELPELPYRISRVYLDIETSSGDPQLTSLNPWRNCTAHLFAITWDGHPTVYCLDHSLYQWVLAALDLAEIWVNQNVKYDAHVLFNNYGYDFKGEFRDTLTLSKLVDSDRTYKGGYGLDVQAKHYLAIDLSYYYASLLQWVGPKKSKDYGSIPLPRLADYAGNQVRANRLLHHHLEAALPEECAGVWATERRLTRTLIDSERRGMKLNIMGVKQAKLRSLYRMMRYKEELEERLGYEINPNSRDDCHDLFINRYGMPPIYTEKKGVVSKNPSFDKNVLKEYKLTEGAPIELLELVEGYRHESTMTSLFWDTWLDLEQDGIVHSDYNQCVRSGRMSCSEPNSQQLNGEARELVVPRDEDYVIVVNDYSQIEYRHIIHYIGNKRIIKAYNDDPLLDFHQFMADECHIKRKPAKILNLAMGYGMGKRKTISSLEREPSIAEFTGGDRNKAREIAVTVHASFHRRLPELKPESNKAENAARQREYVRNAYGRRCHIPLQFSRTAFNRVCQSHAADLIKERANAVDDVRREYGAHILAIVHDETVTEVPRKNLDAWAWKKTWTLNHSSVPHSVPIRCSCGVSEHNWFEAKENGDKNPHPACRAGEERPELAVC